MRLAVHSVPILLLCSIISTSGCQGGSELAGDATDDSAHLDPPVDVLLEIPESWECTQDEDCHDGDGCTLDTCNLSTHECEHDAWTGYGFPADDVQITHDPHYSELGVLTWTGSTFGLAWTDGRDRGCTDVPGPIHCGMDVYFKVVDIMGDEVSSDTRLSHTETTSEPIDGIWTGSEFAVGWVNYGSAHGEYSVAFTTLGPRGAPSGLEIMPAGEPGGSWLSLAWTGSEYGIAWSQREVSEDPSIEPTLRFSRYDSGGVELGDVVLLDERGAPSLVWTGSTYGLFHYRDHDLWFCRVDDAGEFLGEPIETPAGTGRFMQVTWTGSLYAMIWSDMDTDDGSISDRRSIFFTMLSEAGESLMEPVALTDPEARSEPQDIVWTGSEYGITWTQATSTETMAFLMRIDAEGERVEEDVILKAPSLVEWTGSEYVVGWSDDRDGTWQVYMNRIGICE